MGEVKSIVILISGRGSNLRALLEAEMPARVAAVISNRAEAQGLKIASDAGVPTAVVDDRRYATRSAFDAALSETIDRYMPDLVILAGFMRILGDDMVGRYEGRMLNIHPSLLPAFPGLHTHRRALESGVKIHGCTVHFVTSALDSGPVVIQAAVPVLPGDDEDSLAARVLEQEHRVYAQAVRWFLTGRLQLEDGRAVLRGENSASGVMLVPPLDPAAELGPSVRAFEGPG